MMYHRFTVTLTRHAHEYVLYCIPLIESPHMIVLASVGFVVLILTCGVLAYQGDH